MVRTIEKRVPVASRKSTYRNVISACRVESELVPRIVSHTLVAALQKNCQDPAMWC